MTRATGTLHEDQCTFLILSRSVLPRMRNVSDKSCRENQNTRFVPGNFFRNSVYEKMWKNIAEGGRPQMTIWRMRISCWIAKVTPLPPHTHTHTHKLTICNNYCFSTETMLQERVSMLPDMYIACLVSSELP